MISSLTTMCPKSMFGTSPLVFNALWLSLCRLAQHQSIMSFVHCRCGLPVLNEPSIRPNTGILIFLLSFVLQVCPNSLTFFVWHSVIGSLSVVSSFIVPCLQSSASMLFLGFFCSNFSLTSVSFFLSLLCLFTAINHENGYTSIQSS